MEKDIEKNMEKDIQKDLNSHSNDSYDSKETGNSRATNRCPHCSITFKNKSSLLIHLFSHDCDNNYRCNVYACWKKFKAHQDYVDHMLIHQEEYPNGCEICWKRFKSRTVLESHLQTHTMQNKRAPGKMFDQKDEGFAYRCSICEKSFKYLELLQAHMETHMSANANRIKYAFNRCNTDFTSIEELASHCETCTDNDRIGKVCK